MTPRTTSLVAVALVALTAGGCGEDPLAPGPDIAPSFSHVATAWTASGPGTVTLRNDGTAGSPSMSYGLSGPAVFTTQTWTLQTTAAHAQTVTLPFVYRGFHAFFRVRVFVQAFVTGPGGTSTTTLISQGPVNCCTPPSGGFNRSGSHTFTVGAGDTYGFRFGGSNVDSDRRLFGTFTVDVTPPTISLDVDPASLWPPNHEMHLVASGVSATDDVDPSPSLVVTVSSNESDNGTGDGDTDDDSEVVDNGDGTFDVYVRAERSGEGSGRIYTIVATATDASGNSATETAEVTVRHDQGRN